MRAIGQNLVANFLIALSPLIGADFIQQARSNFANSIKTAQSDYASLTAMHPQLAGITPEGGITSGEFAEWIIAVGQESGCSISNDGNWLRFQPIDAK
jgi:hypothetical protein